MTRKIAALFITTGIVIAVFILVMVLSDIPFKFNNKKDRNSKIAAIAIRDNVIPFQKLGSRLFTVSYLQRKYDHFAYFTQYSKDDKKESFKDSLYKFLNTYDSVDVYLLAHSNEYYSWLDTFPENLMRKIRMVYNTGCGNSNQANIWLSMGVECYIGHSGLKSQSPVFYFFFLRRYMANGEIKKSVAAANLMMERFFNIISLFTGSNYQKETIEGTKASLYLKNELQYE